MKTIEEWATILLNTTFRKDFERVVKEIKLEAQKETIITLAKFYTAFEESKDVDIYKEG